MTTQQMGTENHEEGFQLVAQRDKPLAAAQPPFHLALSNNGTSPVVRMRVCLSPAGIAELLERKVETPFLLLTYGPWDEEEHRFTQNNDGKSTERRRIVRLDRGIIQVTFNRPGPHRIMARIVWYGESKLKPHVQREQLEKQFASQRSDGSFERVLTFVDGALDLKYDQHESLNHTEVHAVNVDRAMFAPEPSPRLKAWASLVLSRPLDDQCNWRRRVIFSFTLQPPMLVLWAAVILVIWLLSGSFATIVALLWTYRIYPSALCHPFRNSPPDFAPFLLSVSPQDDWLRTRRVKKGREPDSFEDRSTWWLHCFKPWRILLFCAPVFLRLHISSQNHNIVIHFSWVSLLLTLGWGIAIAAVLCAIEYYLRRKKNPPKKISKINLSWERRQAQVEKEEQERARQLAAFYEVNLSPLVCAVPADQASAATTPTESTRVKDLPPQYRTLELRFEELKSEVCKPFSRG